MYTLIKKYFDSKIYTKENVATFVRAGKLTAEEYSAITGTEYII